LIRKSEGTNPLGITGRGWGDKIKMDLKEIGFGGVDFIRLVQDQEKWCKGRSAMEMQTYYSFFFRKHASSVSLALRIPYHHETLKLLRSKHTKP